MPRSYETSQRLGRLLAVAAAWCSPGALAADLSMSMSMPIVDPTPPAPGTVSATVIATLTFLDLDLNDSNQPAFVTAFEDGLGAAGDAVDVITIDGSLVAYDTEPLRRRLEQDVFLNLAANTKVVATVTRTAPATDDPAAVEAALRKELAAALTLEGINVALDTAAMAPFGDFKVVAASLDLGDGKKPVLLPGKGGKNGKGGKGKSGKKSGKATLAFMSFSFNPYADMDARQ